MADNPLPDDTPSWGKSLYNLLNDSIQALNKKSYKLSNFLRNCYYNCRCSIQTSTIIIGLMLLPYLLSLISWLPRLTIILVMQLSSCCRKTRNVMSTFSAMSPTHDGRILYSVGIKLLETTQRAAKINSGKSSKQWEFPMCRAYASRDVIT